MPFSLLDLVVLGVVIVSALLAAVRGFTREVLAIAAWAAAAAAAWYFHPLLLPKVKEHVSSDTVALVASIGAVFLVTLIIVSIITVKVSDLILDSRIGAIDRTLGFAFGAGRGFLICVIGWVFLDWLVAGRVPEWAAQARTRGVLENSGRSLQAMLPENPEGLLKQIRRPKDGDTAAPPSESDVPPARGTPGRRTDSVPPATAPVPAAPVTGTIRR